MKKIILIVILFSLISCSLFYTHRNIKVEFIDFYFIKYYTNHINRNNEAYYNFEFKLLNSKEDKNKIFYEIMIIRENENNINWFKEQLNKKYFIANYIERIRCNYQENIYDICYQIGFNKHK